MRIDYYKQLIEKLPNAYAYHRVICDAMEHPLDYEYIEVNSAFEKLTGLKKSTVIGNTISKLINIDDDFNWIEYYGEVALNGIEKEIKHYSKSSNKWYKIFVYSPEKYYFVTVFTDITKEIIDLQEKTTFLIALNDIVFELSENLVFLNVFSPDEKLLFMNKEKIIGSKINEILPIEIAQKWITTLQKSKNSGKKESIIYKSIIPGDEKWFKAEVSYIDNDQYKKYITSVIDISEQKRIQDELLYKTEQLENFFEINLDLLCIADLNGNFVKVNKAWEEILGYSIEYLENRSFFEFIHPDDKEATMEAVSKLLRRDKIFNFVNRYRTIDLNYRYIEWRSYPYDNLIYAAARDVTARIDFETKLKEQKDQFELAIIGSNDGIWDWIIASNQYFMSPIWKKQLGYQDDELINTLDTFLKLIHPDDLAMVLQKINQYFNGQILIYDNEYRMCHKDGSYRWIRARGAALRDSEGIAYRMAGSHTDINDQKEAEKSLIQQEKYLRTVLETTQDGFWVIADEGQITDVNDAYCKMSGYSKSELKTMNVKDIEYNYSLQEIKNRVERIIRNGSELFETSHKRKDGSVFNVEVSCSNLDSSPPIMVHFCRDITQRKEVEKIIFNEKEQFMTTLLSVGDGVISTDNKGNIIVMNPIAENLTGWKQNQAFGKPLHEVFKLTYEFSRKPYENLAFEVLKTGEIIELANNTLLVSRTGKEIPVEDSAAPIKDRYGNTTGVVIVFRDFTDKKEKQKQIEFLSFHDHLTGLYNRRYMEDALKRLDTERNLPFTIMILDLNGLKLTNDAFGHEVGDKVIKIASEIMSKVCRADDIISRIGGDEFAILLPNTDEKYAESIKRRINEAASIAEFNSVIVSLAIGYAVKTNINEDISVIQKKADNDMYNDKLRFGKSMGSLTIETVLRNICNKYESEQLHTEKVSQYCELLAKALGLSEKEISDVKTAGALHDIGLIIVQPEILNKQGKLTEEEMNVIKRHPEIGYQILKGVDKYVSLAESILYHHERFDGKGYPKGLMGIEIPIHARIIAVADAYEAMTSKRSYKKYLSKEEAELELLRCAGTQFDSHIVKVFMEKVLFL